MAKLESSAGDMDLLLEQSSSENGSLILSGKLEVYDAAEMDDTPLWMGAQQTVDMDFRLTITPEEVGKWLPIFLKLNVLVFLVLLPFKLIVNAFRDRESTGSNNPK